MNRYFEILKQYVISGGASVSKRVSDIHTSCPYCRFFVGVCWELCWILRFYRCILYSWGLRFICADSQHCYIGQCAQ